MQQVVYYTQAVIGDYKYSSTSNEFNGWLICDGRELNGTDYAALKTVIGTRFGAGTGANFKIPDFRGRVAGSVGSGVGLSARTIGGAVGEENHTLTIPEMPTHTHTATTDTQGAHNHGGATGSTNAGTADGGSSVVAASGGGHGVADPGSHTHSISTDGAHVHNFTTDSTGGSTSHNTMQPTLFGGNYMIFAGVSWGAVQSF